MCAVDIRMTHHFGDALYRNIGGQRQGHERMAGEVERGFLVDFANGGYLFKVVVASALVRHGKHKITFRKPLVTFGQFLGNLHQVNVTRYFGLCPAGDNPFFAVEIHMLDFIMGKCLYNLCNSIRYYSRKGT